jgi:hypothetical protein
VREVLTVAGWKSVSISDLVLDQAHPAGSAARVADVVLEFNPLLVEGLRNHPDRHAEARSAIIGALQPLERDGIVHLQAHGQVVTAHA